MKVLFLTNQRKTVFYDVFARRLAGLGAEVGWISLSRRWTTFLREQGWAQDDILSLPEHGHEWMRPFAPTPDDEARLARIDAGAEAGLNNIIVMDRELARRPGADARAYVGVVARLIEDFARRRSVTHVFGETTWAPELLASEIMRANGGRFVMHHTVRAPSSRIGLFEGIFHTTLARVREPTAEHRAIAEDAIRGLRERGERPYYFKSNMNPQRFRRHWAEEARLALQPGLNAHDHTVPALAHRAARRVTLRVQAARMRRAVAFDPPPADETPFVLVLLHRQPESSVDVLGAPFSNQFAATRALARLLPPGWEIWIKEHAHAIGDRGTDYYDALRALPGARLIAPEADTFALIRRARLVASSAGTACLEAAVLGVPAVTFGEMLWAPILLRSRFDPYPMTRADMAALLDEGEAMRRSPDHADRVLDLVTDMVAQSEPGVFSDPISNPECLAPDNVDRLARFTADYLRQPRA